MSSIVAMLVRDVGFVWHGTTTVTKAFGEISKHMPQLVSGGRIGPIAIPDTSQYMTPAVVSKVAAEAATGLSYVYTLISMVFFLLFLLYNFSAVLSLQGTRFSTAANATLAGRFLKLYGIFKNRREWAAKVGGKGTLWRLAAMLSVEVIVFPFEFLMLFVEGSVRGVGYFFAALPLLIFLVLFTYFGLAIEADPSWWFDLLDGGASLTQDGYNVAAHGVNTVSAFVTAVFLAPFNASMKLGFSIFTLTLGEVGLVIADVEGPSAASSAFASVAQDFVDASTAGGANRRRAQMSTTEGSVDGGALIDMLQTYSVFLAQIFDLIGDFLVIVLKIIFDVLGGVIGPILKAIAPIFQVIACAANSIPCTILEIMNSVLQVIGTIINGIIFGFINAIISIIPGVPPLPPIKLPNIGCSPDALSGISCACSSFFARQPACTAASYSCTQDSSQRFVETTTRNSVTTSGVPGPDASTACPRSERMLSAYGHMVNMHENGEGLACHTGCFNRSTLLRACPAENGEHVLTYEGHCEQNARRRLALEGRGESAVPFASASDYMQTVFSSSASGRDAVRITERARGGRGGGGGGGSEDSPPSRSQVDEGIRQSFARLRTQLPGYCAALGSEEPGNAFSRHGDFGCMVHASVAHSRGGHSEFISTAATAWADKMHRGSSPPRLPLSAAEKKGRRRLMDLATSFSVRATQISALKGAHVVKALLGGGGEGGEDEDNERGGSAVVAVSVDHIFAVARRELAHVQVAVASKSLRRRTAAVASGSSGSFGSASIFPLSGNIFQSKKKLVCAHIRCPGVTFDCVLKFSDCPRPTTWTPRVAVDYAILAVAAQLESLDERVIVHELLRCWKSYETNPKTNPFSPSLIGSDILSNPHVKWCSPMIAPYVHRLPHLNLDMRTMMNNACANGGCACDSYYAGDFDTQNWWFAGVHFFVLSRLHNGVVAAQWFLADLVTKGSWVDTTWQFAFRPLNLPLWFVSVWGDQGMAGSRNTQLLCASMHSASITYIFLLLVPALLLFTAYKPCALWTANKIVAIVLLPLTFAIDGG